MLNSKYLKFWIYVREGTWNNRVLRGDLTARYVALVRFPIGPNLDILYSVHTLYPLWSVVILGFMYVLLIMVYNVHLCASQFIRVFFLWGLSTHYPLPSFLEPVGPRISPRSTLPQIGEDTVASVGRASVFFKEDHSDRSRSYLDWGGRGWEVGGRALA